MVKAINNTRYFCASVAFLLASTIPAFAQTVERSQDTYAGPASIQTKTATGKPIAMPVYPCTFLDASNIPVACSAANPLPVTSAGGGGASDASAANQVTLNTAIGAVTASPTQYTISDRLKTINTTLGSPFQAGASIGNTSFASTQSGTWNVGLSAGANTIGKVQEVDATTVTFTNATATTTLFTATTDNYTGVGLQLSGTWVGTVTFEGSNDNTNWTSVMVLNTLTNTYAVSTTTVGQWYYPASTRYFRARVSAFTSGTVAGASFLRVTPSVAPITSTVTLGTAAVTVGNVGIVAGSASIGNVGLNNATVSTATNSATLVKLISAATTNATSLKASAGRLSGGVFSNTTASFKYVKFYNKASAPTVGTDVPVLVIAVPPNSTIGFENIVGVYGVYFATGISYAITGASADTDTTAVAVGDVIIGLIYA